MCQTVLDSRGQIEFGSRSPTVLCGTAITVSQTLMRRVTSFYYYYLLLHVSACVSSSEFLFTKFRRTLSTPTTIQFIKYSKIRPIFFFFLAFSKIISKFPFYIKASFFFFFLAFKVLLFFKISIGSNYNAVDQAFYFFII